MNSTLDLIIPTKDKGKILAKNLNYLSNISTAIRIVVLDSSRVTDESLKLELTSKSKLSEIIYVKTPNNFTGLQNFQKGRNT